LPFQTPSCHARLLPVIPAKAGIQKEMDPHFHGDDKRSLLLSLDSEFYINIISLLCVKEQIFLRGGVLRKNG